jgi:hypothetical protein
MKGLNFILGNYTFKELNLILGEHTYEVFFLVLTIISGSLLFKFLLTRWVRGGTQGGQFDDPGNWDYKA